MNIKVTTKALDDLTARVAICRRDHDEAAACLTRNPDSKHWQERTEERRAQWQKAIDEAQAVQGPLSSAVYDALHNVNGKATAHTIASYCQVEAVCQRAERALKASGVTKKNRIGVTVHFSPAGPSANAYKYAAKSTRIECRRTGDGWRLIDVQAIDIYPRTPERFGLTVSEAAAEDIRRAAFAGITVSAAA